MEDTYNTTKLSPIRDAHAAANEIMRQVYSALQAKGYDPVVQITGYLLTGDPTYITSYQNARSMVCRLERDDIIEELVSFYVAEQFDK